MYIKLATFFILSIFLIGCGSTNTTSSSSKSSTVKQTDNPLHLYINEVLASNKFIIKDPDYGEYSDYIELYNNSDKTINLTNFSLKEKEDNLIWKFPENTKITSHNYLLIWADKKNNNLHTNFKLNAKSGGTLVLYDSNNKQIEQLHFDTQQNDISFGRNSKMQLTRMKPTPSAKNLPLEKNHLTISIPKSSIYISELLARNVRNHLDPDFYAFSDWIELYNSNDQDADISGYIITDNDNKEGYILPEGTIIKAKSYFIIWADKKAQKNHTNFALSSKGGVVILKDEQKNIIDKITYGEQNGDISYGRKKENFALGYMIPSFGTDSNFWQATGNRIDKPSFSLESGVYNTSKELILSTQNNATIYYTLDGSYPSQKSQKYTNPIHINHTESIRAISYKNGLLPSKVRTATYILDDDQQNEAPIISLVTNPKYFFDDMIGIYTEGKNGVPLIQCSPEKTKKVNYARDWSRPIHIEYFKYSDVSYKKDFSFNLDVQIAGQCSRALPKKSLKFELDDKYGKSTLNYKLYPHKNINKIKDFKLRSRYLEFNDVLGVALAEKGSLNIDYQDYQAVQVYLNGKYWGLYNLREKKGKDYLKSNYPNISSKIDIIDSSRKARHGNMKAFNELKKYISDNNTYSQNNYTQLSKRIDLDNMIDYMCLMIYSGNVGWLHKNHKMWKERKENTKWRFMLNDLDLGFYNAPEVLNNNLFTTATSPYKTMTAIFAELLKNPQFKSRFKERFTELLNTLFTPESVTDVINTLANERMDYIDKEPTWGYSSEDFQEYLTSLRDFAQKRNNIVHNQLNNF